MYGGDRDSETICAVSTPHGVGGISVIRVSGTQSLGITRKIAQFLPSQILSHRAYFGTLTSITSTEAIDEVIVTYFQAGRSFTGEEVVEISCHGNPQICQAIINQLISLGARSADRGEFTYRAFMNGKLDLVQAESVLALIESQSASAQKLALRQLKGQLSDQLEVIEGDITWLMANLEAGIDFSTEGLELISHEDISEKLSGISDKLQSLVSSYSTGRILKDGVRIALVGRPNVGKSSLLNMFLEEDRAIVTDVAGTTRDIISGDTTFRGLKITFLDTAGIRKHTSDIVEQIGIKKSWEAHAEADVVLFVFDLETGITDEDIQLIDKLTNSNLIAIGNKLDRVTDPESSPGFEKLSQYFNLSKRNLFFVSAMDQNVRPLILEEISTRFSQSDIRDSVLVSSARHYENLSKALSNIKNSQRLLKEGMGAEFLAIELKEALIAVKETLGKRFDDQVMDRVFKEFCLGK